jgi:hypothetical protein
LESSLQSAPASAFGCSAPSGRTMWVRPLDADGQLQYLYVTLHGRFIGGQTLVRGSSSKGYGYWVMAPLRTDRASPCWSIAPAPRRNLPDHPTPRRSRRRPAQSR